MSAFLQMKKDSKGSYDKLVQNLDEASKKGGQSYKDDRLYYPERDAEGNGYAVIRFLPAPADNNAPFVKIYQHGFKGPGGWLIERCPTTIDKPCPVCEANNEKWNSGIESDKQIARDRKRKIEYYSNILVVSDSKNRENEGKVFLFRYGQKIFDMIVAAAKPKFEDEKPMDAFNPWTGGNFKLKIILKDGNTNYDMSSFEPPSQIAEDEKIEAIWNQEYDLREFKDPEKYKSETELKNRFARVTGAASPKDTAENASEAAPSPSRASKPSQESSAPSAEAATGESSDSAIDFFRNLGSSGD